MKKLHIKFYIRYTRGRVCQDVYNIFFHFTASQSEYEKKERESWVHLKLTHARTRAVYVLYVLDPLWLFRVSIERY